MAQRYRRMRVISARVLRDYFASVCAPARHCGMDERAKRVLLFNHLRPCPLRVSCLFYGWLPPPGISLYAISFISRIARAGARRRGKKGRKNGESMGSRWNFCDSRRDTLFFNSNSEFD